MRRFITLTTVLLMVVALLPGVASADGHGCHGDYTPIYEIQGSGDASPFDGQVVTTEGVVTVDLQRNEEIRGFFLQDRHGDGDPSTSDGIFVFHQDTWDFDVEVGQRIRVTGEVSEFFDDTELGDLEDVVVCGRGRVPALNIDPRTFNENPEQYEGMYLRYPGRLTVTDTFNLENFGEVWLADGGVAEQPTNEFPGGSAEMHALAEDNIARSILLDDGSRFSDLDVLPYTSRDDTLRVGDVTTSITGGVQYAFSQYRLQPDRDVRFVPANRRPGEPHVRGNVRVVSFNVLNYWTTLGGRGAEFPDQLAVQTEKLVAAIRGTGADIIGLQEMENPESCTDKDETTPCDHTPIETLRDALNAAEGADVWSWVGPVDHYNTYPIRNEILYRNDRVQPVGGPVTIADDAFDEQRDENDPESALGRPPVAQTFVAEGETFTVMVNHLKSKSSTGATGADEDQGDGQSAYNARRVLQAERVLQFVDELVAATGDPDVLVIGDLNSYMEEDPVLVLETELVNLVTAFDKDPYSYNFFAMFAAPFIGRGSLDHALATPSMARVVRDVETWHINADEPVGLDWEETDLVAPGPYRSSDHDPVVIGLQLGGRRR